MNTRQQVPWQQPRSLDAPEQSLEKLTLDDLPEVCRPFIDDIAVRLQCPLEYAAAPFIVGFSALVGRRLGLRIHQNDDWLVVPNLWGAVAGPPGTMKTAAFRRALAPLEQLQVAAFADYRAALRRYRRKQERCHSRSTPRPSCTRFIVRDATIEKLADLLRDNPSGILLYRNDLLGWLRAMNGQRHDSERTVYLEAFSGDGAFTIDRVTRGVVYFPALCLSVFGGLEPRSLESLVLDTARPRARANEFLHRLQIFFWHDTLPAWNDFDSTPPPETHHHVYALFHNIAAGASIPKDLPRHEPSQIPYLQFTAAAQELYRVWRDGLESSLRSGALPYPLQPHRAMYRSLVPSLALLFRLLRGDQPRDVDEADLALALRWETIVWSHVHRLYAPVTPQSAPRRLLHRLLTDPSRFKSFTRRELYRCEWANLSDLDALTHALSTLVNTGHIRVAQSPTSHAVRYELNPLAEPQ